MSSGYSWRLQDVVGMFPQQEIKKIKDTVKFRRKKDLLTG